MLPRLFIHIGPFKTGTTSVQEHFWNNRSEYLLEGLLYPKTGIVGGPVGHRHLGFAKTFRPKVWQKFSEEIQDHDPKKIFISSERLSTGLLHLRSALPFIEKYNPTLVITLRDEVDLVRSMYLQVVKGYFSDANEKNDGRISFPIWWESARHRYVYGKMIYQWREVFGNASIEFLVYPKNRRFNTVTEICKILDVPTFQQKTNSNPSISPFVSRSAIAASFFGRSAGAWAMQKSKYIEKKFPSLRKVDLFNFDPEIIRNYYKKENEEMIKMDPEFKRKYAQIFDS